MHALSAGQAWCGPAPPVLSNWKLLMKIRRPVDSQRPWWPRGAQALLPPSAAQPVWREPSASPWPPAPRWGSSPRPLWPRLHWSRSIPLCPTITEVTGGAREDDRWVPLSWTQAAGGFSLPPPSLECMSVHCSCMRRLFTGFSDWLWNYNEAACQVFWVVLICWITWHYFTCFFSVTYNLQVMRIMDSYTACTPVVQVKRSNWPRYAPGPALGLLCPQVAVLVIWGERLCLSLSSYPFQLIPAFFRLILRFI